MGVGRQFSTFEERVLLPQPAIGEVAFSCVFPVWPPGVLRLRPAFISRSSRVRRLPEQSKSDGFILNWQAKLFERGIASCHCSKIGQFGGCCRFFKIYRKLLKSQLFENERRKIEWVFAVLRCSRKEAGRMPAPFGIRNSLICLMLLASYVSYARILQKI